MATEQGVDISKVAESGKNTAHQGSSSRRDLTPSFSAAFTNGRELYVVQSEDMLQTAQWRASVEVSGVQWVADQSVTISSGGCGGLPEITSFVPWK